MLSRMAAVNARRRLTSERRPIATSRLQHNYLIQFERQPFLPWSWFDADSVKKLVKFPCTFTGVSYRRMTEAAVMPSEIEQLADLTGYFKRASNPAWVQVNLAATRQQ